MRATLVIPLIVAAFAGQQNPSDQYASAIAKYVAGDDDAAFDALARVPHADIQKELEASLVPIRSAGGSPAARRRLEAIAMLHTEYALLGGVQPKEVGVQIDMAHLALSIDRSTIANQVPGSTLADAQAAREFVPRWTALGASVLLTYGLDLPATTLVDEGLKLLPDNSDLLYWRGLVMEFQAVRVGVAAANVQAAVPSMSARDGAGFNMLANTRTWAPIEDAYRRALGRDPDNLEAHLHLGYALYSLRSYGPAKPEYEVARDRSPDPFVVYMADLLLARLKEDENDIAGAAQEYERAIAKMPGAQSAFVGLGLLEARRGNSQRARELTMKLASVPEKRRVRDPWWAYHTIRVPAEDRRWLRAAVHR